MKNLNITAVIVNLLVAVLFGAMIAPILEINPLAITVPMFALGFLPKMVSNAAFALNTEVWVRDIQENLFANNLHVMKGINRSAFVKNLTVHEPQAGANPTVVKNRSSFPATVQKRTDTDRTWDIDEFTTDPFHIDDIEKTELSYDKRASILQQHLDTLNDNIGDEALFAWALNTGARQLRTTGVLGDGSLSPGATGNRRAIVKEDVRRMAALFDRDNVPANMRFMSVPSDVYYELFDDETMFNSRTIGRANLPDGVINEIFGFNVIKRSKVVVYDNAGTPAKKAVGAAAAATDNFGVVCWQNNSIVWAQGAIKVFAENAKPTFYGDLLSALVRYGTKVLRTDEKGVGTIIQAAS